MIDYTHEFRKRSEETLDIALTSVPAYGDWKGKDPGKTLSVDKRYASLPITTKSLLREHTWRGFVPAGLNPDAALAAGEIELVKTSGTTEEMVENVWFQPWWDVSEKLSWEYHRAAARLDFAVHREAILTSAKNTGFLSDERALSFAERTLGRFLYLNERSSPSLWDRAHMTRILDELDAFQPVVLEANPSYLARLSLFARRNGRKCPRPALIVLTYENPTPRLRRLIRLSFGSPIASSYGSTEAGYVFMECENGVLHQNSGSCRVDFESFPEEHGGPLLGRIFVTTFGNPWRVLVRFDIGDIVRLSPAPVCACGKNHGLIAEAVEGRTANLTLTTEGRAVTTRAVDDALADVEGLAMYRVVQTGRTQYEAAIEHTGDARQALAEKEVRDRLEQLYGRSARITVKTQDMIEAEASGKYRATRTAFPFDQESLFKGECPRL